jgi:hypothetical protein
MKSESNEFNPQIKDYRSLTIVEVLLAVELLEYHDKNWLPGSNAIRSEMKQELLRELHSHLLNRNEEATP